MNQKKDTPEQNPILMGDLADFFAVFSDMTRLRIITLLSREVALNVGEIASRLEMSDSAVSHQLKVLRAGDLVRTKRDGRFIYYKISDNHVYTILNMGLAHISEDPSDR